MTATSDNSHDDVEEETLPEDAMDDIDLNESNNNNKVGTILEAAFVDPAYQWPPPDGQGKNAIELRASQALMKDLEDGTMEFNKETQTFQKKQQPIMAPGQRGVRTTKTVVEDSSYRGFWCCKWDVKNQVAENIQKDPFEVDEHGNVVPLPKGGKAAASSAAAARNTSEELARDDDDEVAAATEKQEKKEARYGKVPEGILIYRLNTKTRRLELLSQPHANTNLDTLVRDMTIKKVSPSNDSSRRGMDLVGKDGTKATLVACEQRTAIAWLEVLEMALGKKSKLVRPKRTTLFF